MTKNSNNTIGNRTCNLLACSAVPQPTAPPCNPITTSLTGKKIKNEFTHQLNVDGYLTYDSQLISESINYFPSIAKLNYKNTDKSNNNPLQYLHQAFNNPYKNIKYQNTSTTKIEKIIKSLKSKSSHGYDKISVKVLKISSQFISSPLNYICNKVLSTGILPTKLKYVQIKSLFKKDDKNNISNYILYLF